MLIFNSTRRAYLSCFLRGYCDISRSLQKPVKKPLQSIEQYFFRSINRPVSVWTMPIPPYYAHSATALLSPRYLSSNTPEMVPPSLEKPVEEVSKKDEKAGESHQDTNTDTTTGKPVRGGPVSWLSLILLLLTGAGIIYYYDREKKRHIEELEAASTVVKEKSAGKAAIGGPFNLVNHEGKSVTEKDFMGKWTLIYFGFTHCPDICPDELQKMVAAIDKIKEQAKLEVVPIFISVDPERDTVEQVSDYVQEFHPNLIGLTGSVDEVKQVARAYRVYYMKTEEEGSDYLVDHSIVMYLMDPNMQFVKFFGKNHDMDALTEGVIKEIKSHK